MNKSGDTIASYDLVNNKDLEHELEVPVELWITISVFDVNNDGIDDVVGLYKKGIVFYSLPDLKKELDVEIWKNPGNLDPFPVILHSDVDNDGFDEIITANPEGRIVIIDNGSPPVEKGPGIELIIAEIGILITGAVIMAVVWKKEKMRGKSPEKEK